LPKDAKNGSKEAAGWTAVSASDKKLRNIPYG
jgi:hypothetical protein